MNYDTFVNASFFLQGRADEFTTKTPGKRKEILAELLGVNRWDAYRDAARKRRLKRKQSVGASTRRSGDRRGWPRKRRAARAGAGRKAPRRSQRAAADAGDNRRADALRSRRQAAERAAKICMPRSSRRRHAPPSWPRRGRNASKSCRGSRRCCKTPRRSRPPSPPGRRPRASGRAGRRRRIVTMPCSASGVLTSWPSRARAAACCSSRRSIWPGRSRCSA